VSQHSRSTFVVTDPTEIVPAPAGLKDVRVLHDPRSGRDVALVIEQVVVDARCPSCGGPAEVKERPLVTYLDLPVYSPPGADPTVPMYRSWRPVCHQNVSHSIPRLAGHEPSRLGSLVRSDG